MDTLAFRLDRKRSPCPRDECMTATNAIAWKVHKLCHRHSLWLICYAMDAARMPSVACAMYGALTKKPCAHCVANFH